jgi:HEAT repeat protein
MKDCFSSPQKKPGRRRFAILLNPAMLLTALLVFSSCEEDKGPSDFERRYVLVAIPGFEEDDYAALLDHRDPNFRYLAVANLTARDVLSHPPEEADEKADDGHNQLLEKVRGLLKDKAPKVRAIAAHAPSNQTEPEADLVALLDDDVDAVRVEALAALANFVALKDASIDAIAGQLDDDNILVRFHALTALGASCPDSKQGEITTMLAESLPEREAAEQLLILQSLALLGNEQGGQFVLAELESDDPRFVRAAADLLSYLESDKVEPALLAALERDTVPAKLLLTPLANVATGQSLAMSVRLLSDENPDIRKIGRAILVQIGTEEARSALLDRYHLLTPQVEEQLAKQEKASAKVPEEQLAILGDIEALSKELGRLQFDPESMKELLSSGDAIERRMALRWLQDQNLFDLTILDADAKGPNFLPILLELAKDDSIIFRADACRTLGHSVDSRAKEALLEALEDTVPVVRKSAMESALKYSDNTADHDLLRDLHSRRNEFVPTTWEDEDTNLAIRISLEEAVKELEASWFTRDRLLKDIGPKNTPPTRLIACLFLGQDKLASEKTAPILLDYLASGSSGEKSFTIEVAANSLTKAHLPRLREIADAETDDTLKARLGHLIDQIEE